MRVQRGFVLHPHSSLGRRCRALTACGLLICGLLTACTSGRPTDSDAPAPGSREISALLATHGRSVLDHHAGAFGRGLAGGSRSAAFRARQRSMLVNLSGVPLAAWGYRVAGRTDDRGAERAASRWYGTGAVIARVTLSYRLRGVGGDAARHDLWWTFIRQDGRVRIAGDDDLADAGGVSWRGPWDFGPVEATRGAYGVVLAHPGTPSATRTTIARAVDDAVPAVTAVWGHDWPRQVVVVVPASAAELAAAVGDSTSGGSTSGGSASGGSTSGTPVDARVAALAVPDGASPAGDPGTQQLIVNRAAVDRLSGVGRRIVFRHEVTHIATATSTSAAAPRWLVEGFAEYVGNLGTGQPVPVAAAELRRAVRAGGPPAALPSDAELASAATAAAAYQGAWLACRLVAAQAGQAGLVRFYRQAAGPAVTGDPLTQALRAVVHQTPAQFVAAWRRYLTGELER